MKGPAPKPEHLRQRTNKKSSAFVLDSGVIGEVPQMLTPEGHVWHEFTLLWWKDVWESPMATRFITADLHGLARLALLIDDYWRNPDRATGAEIRQQEAQWGLSNLARMRLEWKIETPEDKSRPAATPTGNIDPRSRLRAVK